MKKYIALIIFMLFNLITKACPVCERNQPKVLRGIVHGTGPETNLDYISVWITVIITVATLYYTIKWLINPGETNNEHIKYSILK